VAASARAQHASDPGTSSVAHLRENLAVAELDLPDTALEALGSGASVTINSHERDEPGAAGVE
jgi:aryl-alcohol dehydrogenase-like predicted oxidoreductase